MKTSKFVTADTANEINIKATKTKVGKIIYGFKNKTIEKGGREEAAKLNAIWQDATLYKKTKGVLIHWKPYGCKRQRGRDGWMIYRNTNGLYGGSN